MKTMKTIKITLNLELLDTCHDDLEWVHLAVSDLLVDQEYISLFKIESDPIVDSDSGGMSNLDGMYNME
jgi:hypothetical protein